MTMTMDVGRKNIMYRGATSFGTARQTLKRKIFSIDCVRKGLIENHVKNYLIQFSLKEI